jgi:molybdate transport system substrate-binding protein
MMRTWYATILALALAGSAVPGFRGSGVPGFAQAVPRVAAASDLKFALEEIAANFARAGGGRVDLIFGSSGTLTHQLLDGAPYDLFLSADEAFVSRLADAGLTRDRGVLYAIGRLVLFAPRGSPLAVDPELAGLRALAERGAPARFAIANPAHAPYGRAAEAVLRRRGLWTSIEPSLVLGENISQAAQFATAGAAAGGLLAYSLVLAPAMQDRGTYALVPASDHPPLRQRMVLLKQASPTAARFYEYLQQPATREVLRRFGFELPREGSRSGHEGHQGMKGHDGTFMSFMSLD